MKYFIVTDIHGFYDEMIAALNNAGFDKNNPEHIFVSLGDLFDRGPASDKCLDYVLSLNPEKRILIRGNHEDLMDDIIEKGYTTFIDEENGTILTISQLTNTPYNSDAGIIDMRFHKKYNKYISLLENYHETKNAVFVHGWIPHEIRLVDRKPILVTAPDWRNASRQIWDNARWDNGMKMWNKGVRLADKTIFCGHFHTSWGHHYIEKTSLEFPNCYSTNPEHRVADFSPFIQDGIVALDACTAYSHQVNCYVLEDEEIDG